MQTKGGLNRPHHCRVKYYPLNNLISIPHSEKWPCWTRTICRANHSPAEGDKHFHYKKSNLKKIHLKLNNRVSVGNITQDWRWYQAWRLKTCRWCWGGGWWCAQLSKLGVQRSRTNRRHAALSVSPPFVFHYKNKIKDNELGTWTSLRTELFIGPSCTAAEADRPLQRLLISAAHRSV